MLSIVRIAGNFPENHRDSHAFHWEIPRNFTEPTMSAIVAPPLQDVTPRSSVDFCVVCVVCIVIVYTVLTVAILIATENMLTVVNLRLVISTCILLILLRTLTIKF